MGEEEKKPPPPPTEEAKKEETAKAEEPAEDAQKEEKKADESKGGEAAPPTTPPPPPPPPPPEIVLRVFMHCEACARKVRRCLKGFEGVEEVITDCKASKVIVKGEKADPVKVLERVQKKSHRQVELISPTPKPPAPKPPEKEAPKPEEKKEESKVISVVLRVYMHCDACAQEIKRRILRMKGVESAEPDLKSSKVIVKGVIESEKLCNYVHKRTGKHATIINVEPVKKEAEAEGEKAESGEEEKAPEGSEKDAAKKAEQESKEAAAPAPAPAPAGGGEQPAKVAPMPMAGGGDLDDPVWMESRKNELLMYNQYPQNFQMYPQRYVQEMNSYPPQMFSDENPNACCVM